eukprot:g2283.t1
MVVSACVSYGGYEFARAASVSLFLTEVGASALPAALLAVAALSYFMVSVYRSVLLPQGAAAALRGSCLCVAAFFMLAALGLGWMPVDSGYRRRAVVGAVFVVRQAYVTFLSSQQFSFIVSLTGGGSNTADGGGHAQIASKLGPLYGVTSLVSAMGAFLASRVTNPYVSMGCASITLVISSIISDAAYHSASAHPDLMLRLKKDEDKPAALPVDTEAGSSDRSGCRGTLRCNIERILPPVFFSHRSLSTLFLVTLLMQAVSSLLGISYATSLETELTGQSERSNFVGVFYFVANGISALVQFFGLRVLISRLGLASLMVVQPCLLMAVILFAYQVPGLNTAAAAALVFKTIEYSLWSASKDLTFMVLPFEARFVAKEFIDVFGYRSGKAGMAVILAMSSYAIGAPVEPHILIGAAGVLTCGWLGIVVKETHFSGIN